jgi:hypothetical protein
MVLALPIDHVVDETQRWDSNNYGSANARRGAYCVDHLRMQRRCLQRKGKTNIKTHVSFSFSTLEQTEPSGPKLLLFQIPPDRTKP